MSKKILVMLLAVSVSLTGCGKKSDTISQTTEGSTNTTTQANITEVSQTTASPIEQEIGQESENTNKSNKDKKDRSGDENFGLDSSDPLPMSEKSPEWENFELDDAAIQVGEYIFYPGMAVSRIFDLIESEDNLYYGIQSYDDFATNGRETKVGEKGAKLAMANHNTYVVSFIIANCTGNPTAPIEDCTVLKIVPSKSLADQMVRYFDGNYTFSELEQMTSNELWANTENYVEAGFERMGEGGIFMYSLVPIDMELDKAENSVYPIHIQYYRTVVRFNLDEGEHPTVREVERDYDIKVMK